MSTIEQLYYGNIRPFERGIKQGGEYAEALSIIIVKQEKFITGLSKEQKEIYEELAERKNYLSGLSAKEAFCDGFSLGVKITTEAYKKEG